MTGKSTEPETLKKSVFDLISECRNNLKSGSVDMSQIESRVRAYCESVSALPAEEGKSHKEDLKELMQLISELGEELTVERDTVLRELSKLDRMRKANVAYKTSDGIVVVKNEDSEDVE